MKKYKHKINGSIAEFVFTKSLTKDCFYSVKHKEGFTHIPIEFIENSNDWEEIKEEPNYLITAFLEKGTGAHRPVNKDGLYGYTEPFKHLDIMLEEEHEIYSVKNSKGEEFTIGDSVMYEKEKFTISNFNIGYTDINIMMAVFNETNTKLNNLNGSNIELISKIKSPIYTTTDGVDIYEGDKITLYPLGKDLTIGTLRSFVVVKAFSEIDKEVADIYLTFTSEENRDKYIKENTKKPIFVSADGVEMFEGDYYYVPQTDFNDNLKGTFLKLTVLNQKYSDNTARFSSPELAQEYIDNNKPKFSFADIFTASEKIPSEYLTTTGLLDELKKLGK
jgi:glutaredoxin